MSTKITGLTRMNVLAINEMFSRDEVTTTATTATFNMDAQAANHLVADTIGNLGGGNSHPRGSLYAVSRKLSKLAAKERVS